MKFIEAMFDIKKSTIIFHKLMIIVFLAVYFFFQQMHINASPEKTSTIKFTGIVEAIRPNCHWDGLCVMIISGNSVVFGMGWNKSPWGKVTGVDFQNTDASIGKKADVYCNKQGKDCTLEGSTEYYIRVQI